MGPHDKPQVITSVFDEFQFNDSSNITFDLYDRTFKDKVGSFNMDNTFSSMFSLTDMQEILNDLSEISGLTQYPLVVVHVEYDD